ncbi:MAG TPA: type II secretion system protein [Firmicutes bacterium]|nr:type II secretion system protein [Bacillota bacterium]
MFAGMGEEGFSLIEVIAVAAILGVIIAPVYSLFAGASLATLLAGEETKAVAFAQERMEEIKGMGYPLLERNLNDKGELRLEESLGLFERETVIKKVGIDTLLPEGSGELLLLQINVSWGEGHRRSTTLTSYLGKGCWR